jgi:hypothetical protein
MIQTFLIGSGRAQEFQESPLLVVWLKLRYNMMVNVIEICWVTDLIPSLMHI